MVMHKLQTQLTTLPHSPGIYKFLDAAGRILYVGKAKSLASRVGQYFQKTLRDGKTRQLVEHVRSIEIIEVFSELEALILEAELIKKWQPKYNILLKDDKSYLYIVLRKEGEFRKVLTARKSDTTSGDVCFGPYPDSYTAKYIVRSLRRLFPFRDCSVSKFAKYRTLGSPCLYGHIGLCVAPCLGKISPHEYDQIIKHVGQFLRGQQKSVVRKVQHQMISAAKGMDYEEAEMLRRTLAKYEYVQQQFRAPREFMENPYLVDDVYEMALKDLLDVIPALTKPPLRIECFDVAAISGQDAAVSMVVALAGRLEKSEYKKFKIKLKDTPDDYFMLTEALTRRFIHETREGVVAWGMPDLVVVDGGKGQVAAAEAVLTRFGLAIPVVGLAKKHETVVFTQHELQLPRSSEALKLLQRLRDESHRFARVYHHHLRSRRALA